MPLVVLDPWSRSRQEIGLLWYLQWYPDMVTSATYRQTERLIGVHRDTVRRLTPG